MTAKYIFRQRIGFLWHWIKFYDTEFAFRESFYCSLPNKFFILLFMQYYKKGHSMYFRFVMFYKIIANHQIGVTEQLGAIFCLVLLFFLSHIGVKKALHWREIWAGKWCFAPKWCMIGACRRKVLDLDFFFFYHNKCTLLFKFYIKTQINVVLII